MIIPNLIDNISITMLSISFIEFLTSQSPYSIRGLMVGAGYGSVFVFTLIRYGIYWPAIQSPFKLIYKVIKFAIQLQSTPDVKVHSPIVKMSFLLVLTFM